PSGTKEAIGRALRWIAAHQKSDGSWSNADFGKECGKLGKGSCAGKGGEPYDVGATGLALLCFLGDGHSPSTGAQREVTARGLDWLVKQQTVEGLIGTRELHHFMYEHALACAALCEGVGLGAEALRAPAERAVAFLLSGRHPEGAWRYDVPATELGDTSITGWAVNALVAASRAGITVEDAALEGAAKWIERVTEPLTGRVGYLQPGEFSARTTENSAYPSEMGEALTAVGLLVRLQLGQKPESTPVLLAHARLISRKPPVIDKEFGGDQYFWYYATCALHELGAPYWDAWEPELRKSVIQGQVKRGDAEGSWDAIGPWAFATGRLSSTALMTLALECFYRYPRALGAK
ncbi:MAG: terpene cyclase/mutase family protein, partial [Planctomycetes bacterium]|nr:terpene cyclase/mutase family protein [Planctomycetota bacterium]